MSDQNSNPNSGAFRPTNSNPRIGRVGQWGGQDSSRSSSSRNGSGPRIATFSDLNASSAGPAPSGHAGHGHAASDDDDDDDDESGGENWFAGGERSGLSVQNPDHRTNVPGGELVKELLRKAAQAGPPPNDPESSTSRSIFGGSGHTLGSDEVESRVVPDPTAHPEEPATGQQQERAIRHLTFWRDGFSVEDGPLMRYDNPENAERLRAIDQGQAPPSLLNVSNGQPVELRVARRTDEEYTPPPPRPHQAFDGTGHRLGAPTPSFAAAGSSSPASAASGSSQAAVPTHEPQSVQTKFEVDQTQPTTSIQLRLADGTRMVCRMNLSHTVRDIRNFINAARPENLTRPYTIATTFPNRVLDDDVQTIEAAGLKNSVVVQRWV
ncbi:SEP-domain-containing protein [Phellopilus nigrolimitatus]|nr:SEP-domain-containing protein [Phellopilus nigrolimitatus]